MLRKAFEYALPYIIEYVFGELLSKDVKDKVKNKEPLTKEDVERTFDNIDAGMGK